MSKIIVSDSSIDPFRNAIGSSRQIITKNDGENIISLGGNKTLKIQVLSKEITTEGDYYAEKVKIKIKPNSNVNGFEQDLLSSIRLGIGYFDHFITLPKIQSKTTMTQENPVNTVYDCSSVYNYPAPRYESLYSLHSEVSCPPVFSQVLKEEYFQGKGNLFYQPGSGRKNIVYPENKDLNSQNKLKNFPFYNKINITTDINSGFCDFIKKIGIFDSVLGGYLNYLQGSPTTVSFSVQNGDVIREGVEIPVFDISSWIKQPNTNIVDSYYPLGDLNTQESGMFKQYKKLLLAGYINKISLNNFRSFEDIIRGKESHKEDLAISIEKGVDSLVNKLQTIFFPANNNHIAFNDTQVKYGKNYIYKCTSHYIIVGNKYRYENFELVQNQDIQEAHLEVINQPSVVVVPIDLFEKNINVIQPPPMIPEVKFTTENNSSKEMKVYLTSKKGKSEGLFTPLFDSDTRQQQILGTNNPVKVTFQEYNESALFEVFVSDNKPKDYSDFSKVTEVRMPDISQDALYHTKVKPNRSVYYMFRKINQRGLVSNPTPIYEVRLILDADDSKVEVKTYSFPEEITYQETKKFQSLFQIKPSFEQIVFESDQPFLIGKDSLKGTLDNVYLGPREKAIWGRKIKFRFKSTTTGKIIDYNITFKLTKNKTSEDF